MPESIHHLINLRKLSLENNALEYLPKTIGQLSHLNELNLRTNKLTTREKNNSNHSTLEDKI